MSFAARGWYRSTSVKSDGLTNFVFVLLAFVGGWFRFSHMTSGTVLIQVVFRWLGYTWEYSCAVRRLQLTRACVIECLVGFVD